MCYLPNLNLFRNQRSNQKPRFTENPRENISLAKSEKQPTLCDDEILLYPRLPLPPLDEGRPHRSRVLQYRLWHLGRRLATPLVRLVRDGTPRVS